MRFSQIYRSIPGARAALARTATSIVAIVVLIVPAIPVDAQETREPQELSPEQRFAMDVMTGTEYGDSAQRSRRWVKSPTLSVIGGSAYRKEVVAKTARMINAALKGTSVQLKLGAPGNQKADIKLYFDAAYRFDEIAKKHGFKYVKGNPAFVWVQWNRQHQLFSAVILIDDRFKSEELKHHVLEECVQALGLLQDSARYPDSIFFEVPKKKLFGTATHLNERDARLIRFYYKHIQPGATRDQVAEVLKKSWKTKAD